MKTIQIKWNGFFKKAIDGLPNEVCAFLYAKNIYSDKEEWFVFEIENVSENPEEEWIPSKKDMAKIKRQADKLGLIKIGNVHTHPYFEDDDLDKLDEYVKPSEKDLWYAKKFNDLIRIILLVKKDGGIMNSFVHDKFGNKINLYLESKET